MTLSKQAEGHSAATLALQQDLDEARAAEARERESRRKDDNDVIQRLTERCNRLENERDEFQGTQVRPRVRFNVVDDG